MSGLDRLGRLVKAGVAVWLDGLSRHLLTSGALARLIRDDHVVGVTTDAAVHAAALADGASYEAQVRELVANGADPRTAARALTTTDVRYAADLFLDHRAHGGADGRVSVEVDPRLARDTDAMVEDARALWSAVGRNNVLVKIPATAEGLPAITRTLAAGIGVQATLVFSPERYRQVVEAFFSGLEHARRNGHELRRIQSVAAVSVSRTDAEVDARLDALGGEARALRGRVALANAQLTYGIYEEMFATPRWRELAAAGAVRQRPLWASTGVADPACPDTMYVEGLVAPGVVAGMPRSTLRAFAEHGTVSGDTLGGTRARRSAREVFDRLSAVGIDPDDVYRSLEDQGVEECTRSWEVLLDTVRDRLARAGG